jgi:hypothetical protein
VIKHHRQERNESQPVDLGYPVARRGAAAKILAKIDDSNVLTASGFVTRKCTSGAARLPETSVSKLMQLS